MKKSARIVRKTLLAISCQLLAIGGMAQVQPTVKDTSYKTMAPPVITFAPTQPMHDTGIHVLMPDLVQSTENKIYQCQRYNHATSPGFRIQINFGQEKSAVYTTQSDFSAKYPGVPSYVTYKQPYFRVSVGDFRTRLEAIRFLNNVRRDYPAAFMVADKIMPPPLQ